MDGNEFTQIRKGHRAASPEKLSKVIDLEQLREPIINEMQNMLNSLDTELLITLYNLIYAKERDK